MSVECIANEEVNLSTDLCGGKGESNTPAGEVAARKAGGEQMPNKPVASEGCERARNQRERHSGGEARAGTFHGIGLCHLRG